MKRVKKVLVKVMVSCMMISSVVLSDKAYADSVATEKNKLMPCSYSKLAAGTIDKKTELIANYVGCKTENLNYYGKMTVDGKNCWAFEYIDKYGGAADFLILIFEDGKIIGYYPTGDYTEVKDRYKSTNKAAKVNYTMKQNKIEYKDTMGRVRGIVYYQYPQFKGTSAAVKKINKKLKQESNKFLKSENAKSLKEYTQSAIEYNRFYDEEEQYFWTTSCELTYNKNNIVSIHMQQSWYAGGVYNQSDYGWNYNIKTGKKLSVTNVISGNAKEKILKSAKEYCGSDTNAYTIIENTKEYNFYFEKNWVHICYGSYELERGSSCDVFSVEGKYK